LTAPKPDDCRSHKTQEGTPGGEKEEGFAPDEMAPAVDQHYLRLYVRQELAPDTMRLVEDLIALFRPWRAALAEVLHQEQDQREPFKRPPPS
jgi:hypothetical protein